MPLTKTMRARRRAMERLSKTKLFTLVMISFLRGRGGEGRGGITKQDVNIHKARYTVEVGALNYTLYTCAVGCHGHCCTIILLAHLTHTKRKSKVRIRDRMDTAHPMYVIMLKTNSLVACGRGGAVGEDVGTGREEGGTGREEGGQGERREGQGERNGSGKVRKRYKGE